MHPSGGSPDERRRAERDGDLRGSRRAGGILRLAGTARSEASRRALVNTARGPVVDEVGLAAALEEGRLFAAGLDVYENEPLIAPRFLAAPHVIMLPHMGSASIAARTAAAWTAAASAAAVLAGKRPGSALNSVLGSAASSMAARAT